jgi:hypothetical protein
MDADRNGVRLTAVSQTVASSGNAGSIAPLKGTHTPPAGAKLTNQFLGEVWVPNGLAAFDVR